MDKLTDLPIVALPGLSGNGPAELNALQSFLLPWLPMLIDGWFFCWWGILLYLVVRNLSAALAAKLRELPPSVAGSTESYP